MRLLAAVSSGLLKRFNTKLSSLSSGSLYCSPVYLQNSHIVHDSSVAQHHTNKMQPVNGEQVLCEPEKSPNDKREYRSLLLSNGLRALLVSDMHSLSSAAADMSDTSVVMESASDAESCGEESGSESEDGDSSADDEGGGKMAAAALCVNTGSFRDPPDIPGLAHFVEHMVFLGSKKYPEENLFDSFVTKHGGCSNAFTECEHTVFYFNIVPSHFTQALDMFAQFFIHPLMTRDAVDREIKAVDSEFDESLQSDGPRKEQLYGSMAKEGNPLGKFMWGNIKSLKTDPLERGVEIYDHVELFHNKYYSSRDMCLVVQTKDTLDNLQKLVVDIFSEVPQKAEVNEDTRLHQEPYDCDKFYKLYKAIPVCKTDQLEIRWALPSLLHSYRSKPLGYLGWLVGHEGSGSILSYLKKCHWATELEGGNGETGMEHNTICSTFTVAVTLTELGVQHVPEILTVVFTYLEMLCKVGPQRHLFEEVQTIEKNTFRFQEAGESVDYVERLSPNMKLFPPEHYLCGDCLTWDFDEKLITRCLSYLVPSRASLLLYTSSCTKQQCPLVEPWFTTQYGVQDIPEEWKNQWQDLKPIDELHIPEKNLYIATDFEIRQLTPTTPTVPKLIWETDKIHVWYLRDTKFNIPKVHMYFMLFNPVTYASAENACLFNLFVRTLAENLSEVAYSASVAQLSYSFSCTYYGLEMKISGFNHKIKMLLDTIIAHIVDFDVTDGVFTSMVEQQDEFYHNRAIKPSYLKSDLCLSIMQEVYWTNLQKQEALKNVTKEKLLKFAEDFKKSLFINSYVHGNYTVEDTHQLQQYLLSKLVYEPLPPHLITHMRGLNIAAGEQIFCVANHNAEDDNSVITNYYQYGPGSLRDATVNSLFIMHMEEPVFDTLRTKEQLGYDVRCAEYTTWGVLDFSITVHSQATKYSMSELNQHIEKFLVDFGGQMDSLEQEEFDELVRSMVKLKLCEDTYMSQESDRHWAEIYLQWYRFDRLQQEVKILEALTLDEFKSWFCHIVGKSTDPSVQVKKLSVQVQGHAKPDSSDAAPAPPADTSTSAAPRHYTFTFINNSATPNDSGPPPTVQEYRTQCGFYPASKCL